jgi:arylsulfatase A-like enzyme
MKETLVRTTAFFIAAFVAASFIAACDVIYNKLTGVYLQGGFQSVLVSFAQSVVIDFIVLVFFSSVLLSLSILISAIKGKPPTFDDQRWAFIFGPSFVILIFIIVVCVVNIAIKSPILTFKSLSINLLLLTSGVIISVLSIVFGNRVVRYLKKKPFRITAYVFGLMSIFCVVKWFVFFSAPTNVPLDIPIDGPNVIIITIDALRQDRVGSYNVGYIETPNLDRFATKAVRFEQTRFPGSWTVPSMYSMLSSRYPSAHGAGMRKAANPRIIMLAEILKSHGYTTEAYVANLTLYGGIGFNRGFDRYVDYHDVSFLKAFEETTVYRFIYRLMPVVQKGILSPLFGFKPADSTKWLTGAVLDSLERNRDKPFFLWAHYMDPHTPLLPPRKYVKMDTESQIDEAITLGELRIADYDQKEKDREKLVVLYEAEVRYVDDMFGRILAKIENEGFYEDTVIIVTSDHGEEFFEHGAYGHARTHYYEVAALPLLIYVPGLKPGVTNYPASLVDLMPTILDYVGACESSDAFGESLKPILDGNREPSKMKFLFTDRLGDRDPSMKSIYYYPFTLIRTGYDNYTYEMVDVRIGKGPGDIVTNPDPEIFNLLRDELDRFAREMEKETAEFGSENDIEFDDDRTKKLKELGYID